MFFLLLLPTTYILSVILFFALQSFAPNYVWIPFTFLCLVSIAIFVIEIIRAKKETEDRSHLVKDELPNSARGSRLMAIAIFLSAIALTVVVFVSPQYYKIPLILFLITFSIAIIRTIILNLFRKSSLKSQLEVTPLVVDKYRQRLEEYKIPEELKVEPINDKTKDRKPVMGMIVSKIFSISRPPNPLTFYRFTFYVEYDGKAYMPKLDIESKLVRKIDIENPSMLSEGSFVTLLIDKPFDDKIKNVQVYEISKYRAV